MNFISDNTHTYLNINEKIVAELTYELIEENTMLITHTFVDESLRGKGIANKLVEAGYKYLINQGFNVKASCSYAKKWLETNEIK